MSIVELKDIHRTYKDGHVAVHALRGVNLSIEEGEFIAIAGPSGSGKTTMLNIMGGLDRADSGTVTVDGNRLEDMSQSELAEMRLKRVGFIFQAYNLIPVLSALENVEYVMLLQGIPAKERKKRSLAILEEVGLEGLHDRRPTELSGGQQQRVAVARAVVSNPAIVLADEPTANLDSEMGEGLLHMMSRMNEIRGITFIFSTHDRMVMEHARRLVRIRDGKVESDVLSPA